MRFEDPAPDREMAEVLRRFEPARAPSPDRSNALARRIVTKAGPLMNRRRHGVASWWEYAAVWSRTLIPVGITTAVVAAASLLWAAFTPVPDAVDRLVARDTLIASASNAVLSERLIDALVGPVEQAATPARARR